MSNMMPFTKLILKRLFWISCLSFCSFIPCIFGPFFPQTPTPLHSNPLSMTNPNKERTKNEFGMDNWLRKTVKKKKSKSSQAKPRGVSELFQTRERERYKNHPLSRQFNESTKRPSTRNRHGECVSVCPCVMGHGNEAGITNTPNFTPACPD
jgi:hypothetical protein